MSSLIIGYRERGCRVRAPMPGRLAVRPGRRQDAVHRLVGPATPAATRTVGPGVGDAPTGLGVRRFGPPPLRQRARLRPSFLCVHDDLASARLIEIAERGELLPGSTSSSRQASGCRRVACTAADAIGRCRRRRRSRGGPPWAPVSSTRGTSKRPDPPCSAHSRPARSASTWRASTSTRPWRKRPAPPRTKPGDLWVLGEHRLLSAPRASNCASPPTTTSSPWRRWPGRASMTRVSTRSWSPGTSSRRPPSSASSSCSGGGPAAPLLEQFCMCPGS